MENQEQVHELLTAFEKKPTPDIPDALEDYLRYVAKTGKITFPWNNMKPLFVAKLEQVIADFNKEVPYDNLPAFPNVEQVKFDEMRQRVLDAVHRFNGAPFTIQRMCELVTQSRAHYTRCDKFLRGIEKNVMVVTTVDPSGRRQESQRMMVNGLDLNGVYQEPRQDINDFTGGLPFSKIAAGDWSNSSASVTSAWPQSTGSEGEGSATAQSSDDTEAPQTNGGQVDSAIAGASGTSADIVSGKLIVSDGCSAALSQIHASQTSSTTSAVTTDNVIADSDNADSCESHSSTDSSEDNNEAGALSDSMTPEPDTSSESESHQTGASTSAESQGVPTSSSSEVEQERCETGTEEVGEVTSADKRSAEESEEGESQAAAEGPPVKRLKVDKNPEEPSSVDKSDNEAETDSTEVTQSSGEAETDAMGESSRAPEENEQPESEQCDSNSDNTDLPEASQSHENESEVSVDNKTELIDTDNCDDDSAVGSSQDNPADNTETEAEVRVEDVENVQDVEQSRQEDMDSKDMVSSESENIEESVDAVVDCDRTEEEDVESVSEAEAAKEEMMDTDAHSEDKAEDREVVSTSEGEPMDQE